MNNRRDTYLREMEARLRHLPEADRAEEMAEVTQHFDFLIAACQNEGKSQSDATEEAIAQFGAARDIGSRLYHADKHKRFVPLIEVGLFYIVLSSLIEFAEQGFCAALKAATYGLALRGTVPEATAQTVIEMVRPRSFLMGPYGWALQLALFSASAAVLASRYGLPGAIEKARQSPPVNAVLRWVLIGYLLVCFSPRAWYHVFAVLTHRSSGTMPVGLAVACNIAPVLAVCFAAYFVGKTNRSRESDADAVGCAAVVGAATGILQSMLQFLPVPLGGITHDPFLHNVPSYLLFFIMGIGLSIVHILVAYFSVLWGEKSRRAVPPPVEQIVA